jgi:hypothetical protein
MKRFAWGAGLLAAAAALPLSPAWAEDKPAAEQQPPAHCTGGVCPKECPKSDTTCPYGGCPESYSQAIPDTYVVPPVVPSTEHKSTATVVDDLVAVLAETKSKDVYTATVVALAHLGTDARAALPDILKHAERLGVLEGAFVGSGCKSIQCEVVLDAVAAIAHGPDRGHHCGHHGYAACPYHHGPGETDCVLPPPKRMEHCDPSADCPLEQHHKRQHKATLSSGSDMP